MYYTKLLNILIILIILITLVIFLNSLLYMFRTVFSYKNKVGHLIMDTEKAHSIKHCHVDFIIYSNPLNCSCDGPEGGHKK